MTDLVSFTAGGTRLLRSPEELARRASGIRAVLFDWDGVFNDGWKDLEGGSPFSEVGSMGVNMLRFAIWLTHGEQNPPSAVVTGQHNSHAEKFAKRECFHGLYMGFTHKPDAFERFLNTHGLRPEQVAFFYDDAIDLSVAEHCGFRVMIGRSSGPLFEELVTRKGLADVITANSGGANGLREATELLIGLVGRFDEAIEHRASFSATYQRYLTQRNAVDVEVVRNAR